MYRGQIFLDSGNCFFVVANAVYGFECGVEMVYWYNFNLKVGVFVCSKETKFYNLFVDKFKIEFFK